MLTADYHAEYGVQQVADQLHESLKSFLESRYHIRDVGVIAERSALLDEIGTINQDPFIETTPMYALGHPYRDLRLPANIAKQFADLSTWDPSVGIYERPYHHQAEALESFLSDSRDLLVATGTGSGKTEIFLFSILAKLLAEAQANSTSFKVRGARALILYPMNALVSDQMSRLRRLFGDKRVSDLFLSQYGRCPTFGMYTSRTPYPGPRTNDKDSKRVAGLFHYYVDLEKQALSSKSARELVAALKERGRWPAKNIEAFLGNADSPMTQRLVTHPHDSELVTRHEIQMMCPDILVTNYSMLEYMLLRPIERSIFNSTRKWLEADEQNEFILVLDEAHMYRGAAGAEVAFLIRRLQSRLGISRDRMRCILTSASLGSESTIQVARSFAESLTGSTSSPQRTFSVITGKRESRPAASAGNSHTAQIFSSFDLPSFFLRAEKPQGAFDAVAALASKLGWSAPPLFSKLQDKKISPFVQLRKYLYDQLFGFGPIELLISQTSGNGVRFKELSGSLFANTEQTMAEEATMSILALGTYAHDGKRPLLPTRVHLFYRALPSLYACINPLCDVRRHKRGEKLLLGRLYTEPRTHCTCAVTARVYELFTHRDCGATFLRTFGRGAAAEFYWHEQGGDVEAVGKPLNETLLFLERPHDEEIRSLEPIWLELTTGRVATSEPIDSTNYRMVYRASNSAGAKTSRKVKKEMPEINTRRPEKFGFAKCPACTKTGKDRITDLANRGEQSFAHLVREQIILQPAEKQPSKEHPNGGRKLLIFSDGRQKAARLARDLPREVEFDSLRYALALSVKRLGDIAIEPSLDRKLYTAFVSVCQEFFLHFFDNEGYSQRELVKDIARYEKAYSNDLAAAIDEEFSSGTFPLRYKQGLLRQLSHPFHSVYKTCLAVVSPTTTTMRKLKRALGELTDSFPDELLSDISHAFIQALLEETAFDPSISEDARRDVDEYFQPLKDGHTFTFCTILKERGGLKEEDIETLRRTLFDIFTQTDERKGAPHLIPGALKLQLAIDKVWYKCGKCLLLQYRPVLNNCIYCGSETIDALSPDDPYMHAKNGYFREPFHALLKGARPVHLTAEEHSAQLSHRDSEDIYATTEEFELRFQDVPLGQDKTPIDVLSCTTTMEVGIDLGALTAVSLRNVPPQRENYQQRAGRAGRRGSAVSTVITYAQGGPHEGYYFQNPWEIISGPPREPKVKVDNVRLLQRHINAFLIQTFFHSQIDAMSIESQRGLERSRINVFSALGTAREFFAHSDALSYVTFKTWLKDNVVPGSAIGNQLMQWIPTDSSGKSAGSTSASFTANAVTSFLNALDAIEPRYLSQPQQTAVGNTGVTGPHSTESDPLLLDLLFDEALLPTYAFPTDVAPFYVFERHGKDVKIKEKPQQSKDKALSEYAPGRALVINKKSYRVGGIYIEGTHSPFPGRLLFEEPLPVYVYCPKCTYVRLDSNSSSDSAQVRVCPICETELATREMLDPPGFSPESGEALDERDRDQEITYATSAQFPTPLRPERFDWYQHAGKFLRCAYSQGEKLVVVNQGPNGEGFAICDMCGAAWPGQAPTDKHNRPFLIEDYILRKNNVWRDCKGPIHSSNLYLGTTFTTDLLLIRLSLNDPMDFFPLHPWLHDALRTLAEALCIASALKLDIDPAELSAGYRLMNATLSGATDAGGLADLYLFDTAAGGAGYSAEAGEQIDSIIAKTMQILTLCPGNCERSCTKCLRHYGNRQWHERLDRALAAQLLTYVVDGMVPSIDTVEQQAKDLRPLARYLELEGWHIQSSNGILPLVASTPEWSEHHRTIQIGTYPALLDRESNNFAHPLLSSKHQGPEVFLVNKYVLARDLPTAYHQVMSSRAHAGTFEYGH